MTKKKKVDLKQGEIKCRIAISRMEDGSRRGVETQLIVLGGTEILVGYKHC